MKIVTWNTQWCCGLDGVVSPARIVQGARALADFDVLCLQEIAVNYPGLPGRPGDQPEQLRALLPGYALFYGAAVDEFSASGRQRFGNLIATRLPVLQVQHHPLPYPADPTVPSMPRMCTVVTVRDPALGPVRVMTTHLEYYSRRQRMAQALALRDLHLQALAVHEAPPVPDAPDTPFQAREHTAHTVLCGDFNLEPHEPEYAALAAPWAGDTAIGPGPTRLWDAWRLLHPGTPQPPTFRLYDQRYGPEPGIFDFAWVSESLRPQVRHMAVDGLTQASDHQPVTLTLG